MEYWFFFSCALINQNEGAGLGWVGVGAAVMKYAARLQQLVSSPIRVKRLEFGAGSYSGCAGMHPSRTVSFTPLSACLSVWHTLMAKWLRLWLQDDDSAWRRRHAGQRWRADIRAGWFDGDKKDTQGLGPQTSCHWRGLGWADEMWVTAAQMHNIPQPKSPWTLFSFKEPIYYKYCHKAYRAVDFFWSVHELRDVFSWKQHPSVTVCQKPVPHAWRTVVTFHMAIIICCLLFVAISGTRSHSGISRAACLRAVRCK